MITSAVPVLLLATSGKLPIPLAFAAVTAMHKLFDFSRFRPGYQQLNELITGIEPKLAPGAATYTRDRLSHLLAAIALDTHQDASVFTFREADFDLLAHAAPSLLGQTGTNAASPPRSTASSPKGRSASTRTARQPR
jgi:hypothetical protein